MQLLGISLFCNQLIRTQTVTWTTWLLYSSAKNCVSSYVKNVHDLVQCCLLPLIKKVGPSLGPTKESNQW